MRSLLLIRVPAGLGLSQDWARLLWIHRRTTGHGSDSTEPLIGGNEYSDLSKLVQIKGDGQLQSIQSAETFGYPILNQ